MNAVEFDESNIVIAKDQPQYRPLPAHLSDAGDGRRITFCWRLTWRERFAVLFGGHIWHQVLTFGGPLQPQKLTTDKPEMQ